MKLFLLILALTLTFYFYVYPVSLNDAYKDYLGGDYEEALIKAKHLGENDAVLYFLGLTYIKIGNYPQARDYLIKLKKNYPRSKFYEQALTRLADTYFLEGNLAKAKSSYEDILKKYPSYNYQPLVYLRLAQISNKEGIWQDKKLYLNKLKDKYPQAAETRFINILESKDDFFTIQVGAFSNIGNAVSLKEEIVTRYEAYIAEDKNHGYVLYKVRVGKFKSRKDAEKIYVKLIKQGYPARIIP
jgi:tetratricopeptide (TPR) repeat protein